MKVEELEHGRIYKVTREVLKTWSEGDLFRCDRTTTVTRLVLLKHKKVSARSTYSSHADFRHVVAALTVFE